MKTSKQKKLTKIFFDDVAGEWYERTYDAAGTFEKFPSNRARMETALGEIQRLTVKGNFLDIGCGTGHLVLELIKRGRNARGIDISPRMIEEAKTHFRKSKLKGNPDDVFAASDLSAYKAVGRVDAAVGLGLLEYLDTDRELFTFLRNILPEGGYAFVECRNELFSLFSGNQYTADMVKRGEYSRLLKEFMRVDRFSTFPSEAIPSRQAAVSREIATFLAKTGSSTSWSVPTSKQYTRYPAGMVRRQHTPEKLEQSAKKYGFKLDHVVYWHLHPYTPSFERHFPRIFNRMSYLMAPLGHTPAAAGISSSFLAVLRKQQTKSAVFSF